MASRGRPRKTQEQRIAEGGTPGKGAISHRPVKKAVVLSQRLSRDNRPQAPEMLPPQGKELWDEVIEELIDYNAAQNLDVPTLTFLCLHYALALAAYDVILQEGAFTYGSTGQVKEHPALRVFERHSDSFLKRATEFGLTTLARTRLGLLDVTTRSMQSDLDSRLGTNPRKTNRPQVASKKQAQIEA